MIWKEEATVELARLRAAALHMATCGEPTVTDYGDLRERARTLNSRYELSSEEEFEQILPSPTGLAEIRRLETTFGSTAGAPIGVAPVSTETLLLTLAGWAAGMHAACKTWGR